MKVNQGLLGGKETRGILPGLFQGNGYLILPGLFQGNGYLHPKVWEEDDGKDKPAGEKEKEAFLGVDPGGARLPGQVLSGISRRFFFFFFLAMPNILQDLSFPTREQTQDPLHWKPRVLTTGPSGMPPRRLLHKQNMFACCCLVPKLCPTLLQHHGL